MLTARGVDERRRCLHGVVHKSCLRIRTIFPANHPAGHSRRVRPTALGRYCPPAVATASSHPTAYASLLPAPRHHAAPPPQQRAEQGCLYHGPTGNRGELFGNSRYAVVRRSCVASILQVNAGRETKSKQRSEVQRERKVGSLRYPPRTIARGTRAMRRPHVKFQRRPLSTTLFAASSKSRVCPEGRRVERRTERAFGSGTDQRRLIPYPKTISEGGSKARGQRSLIEVPPRLGRG